MHRLVALFLLLVCLPFPASADETAPSTKSIVLVLTSSKRRDEAIKDIVTASFTATGRLTVQDVADGADLIGRLEVIRFGLETTLDLTVVDRTGTIVLRARRTVDPNGSVADTADLLARMLVAAASSDRPAVAEPAAPPPPPTTPAWQDKQSTPEDHPAFRKRLDFFGGVELGVGPWNADPTKITSVKSFDFTHYAASFTRNIDQQWHVAMNLHGGWKFLGYAAIEAAIQSSAWGAGSSSPGGATLVGVRATLYPLQIFLPDRKFDLGVEMGGGYAFVASAPYDMDGSYFTFGLTGRYMLRPWMSLDVFYRLFTPFLSRFYIDYHAGITEPVQGFTAYWNTLGVGVSFFWAKYL